MRPRKESDLGKQSSDPDETAKKLNINRSEQRFGTVRTIPLQVGLPPTLMAIFLLLAGLLSMIWAARLSEMKDMAIHETNQTAFLLATRLENTTSVRIVSLLSQWYEANFKAFTVLSQVFKDGVVGRSDFDKLYWLLLATVKANPTMTGLVFADRERNSVIAISRMDNGSYTFELQSTPASGLTCTICPTLDIPITEKWYYLIDSANSRPFSTPYLRANYSMTSRPWYTTPITANATIWSDFYRRSNGLTGQMNLGEPLFATNGSGIAWGVLSLEASAHPISEFLNAGVADAPDTTAYVMDTRHKLMGTSAKEPVLVNQVQVGAVNSTDPFTKFTAPIVVSAIMTNADVESKLVRSEKYWFKYARYHGQASAQAVIVAGTPTASYLGALDRVQLGFESTFAQSIRDATLFAVGFALLCACVAVFGLHRTVIRPLKDVCVEMVMATKFEFQALTDGAHKMRPSRVQELNKVQYSFRALVAEFASGIKVSRTLSVKSAKAGGPGPGSSMADSVSGVGSRTTASTVGVVNAARNLNGNTRNVAE